MDCHPCKARENYGLYSSLVIYTFSLSDILLGMPATSPQDIESKIHWEHTRYLVAELDVKVGFNGCDCFHKLFLKLN